MAPNCGPAGPPRFQFQGIFEKTRSKIAEPLQFVPIHTAKFLHSAGSAHTLLFVYSSLVLPTAAVIVPSAFCHAVFHSAPAAHPGNTPQERQALPDYHVP